MRGALAGAAGVVLLAACAGALAASQGAPAGPGPLPAGDTLRQPTVVRSENGQLRATLRVVMATLPVPYPIAGTPIPHPDTLIPQRLRAYQLMEVNGRAVNEAPRFPGPTFRVRPGDLVRITLINDLPPDSLGNNVCVPYNASQARVDTARHIAQPPVDQYEDCFHGSNYTNIHYHGMHVTPDSTGDNVFLLIAPGDTFHYSFQIPHNQSPGTHWYHPHKHGSVAIQVTNGMAGGFIVEGGGLDSLTAGLTPASPLPMRERLIAIQQVDPNVNLVDDAVAQAPLVNGQYIPVVEMYPGEVQRWRIVNENVSHSANYKVTFQEQADEPRMYDVARDGVQYAPANYNPHHPDRALDVAPGSRLDVFVHAPTRPGLHRLVARRDTAIRAGRPGLRNRAVDTIAPLLQVRVVPRRGRYVNTLPAALPPLPGFLANLQPLPADTAAFVVFTETGAKGGGGLGPASQSPPSGNPPNDPPSYFLGTAQFPFMKFDHRIVFMQMPLGATHIWKVINRSPNQLNHPFHIHINPFQVLRVHAPDPRDPNHALYADLNEAARRGSPIWLDVVPLPAPRVERGVAVDEGYVVIAQRYENFTGKYVMHCHILGHEERGMMQTLEVVTQFNNGVAPDTGGASRAGAGHSHHHH